MTAAFLAGLVAGYTLALVAPVVRRAWRQWGIDHEVIQAERELIERRAPPYDR